jgi:hypothetical protein
MSLIRSLAVSTRSIQFSERISRKIINHNRAGAIMLDDLILGSKGSSTVNRRRGTGVLEFNREGILADGRPPDVRKGTGTLTVYTFDLVRADDDVREGSAFFDVEYGV